MNVNILTEADLRKAVPLDAAAVASVESAFAALAEGKAEMPPIMHIPVVAHRGDVDIKAAFIHGMERFAVKIGAGFFENYKLGLPNSPAMMNVVSAKTGFVEAILLDNAYLTDVRTGAAGAVAAKYLAPQRIETAGVIATGAQGRYQILGLKLMRDFKRLLAFDLNKDRLIEYAKRMRAELQIPVEAVSNPKDVFELSQFVVTCTPSRKPYVSPDWLHPGLHITCMGADLPVKRELMPGVLSKADRIVCDKKSQCYTMGELHHGVASGEVSEASNITELGELVIQKSSGRRLEREITLCDLTGTGVQDTAIADLALRKANDLQLGTIVDIGF